MLRCLSAETERGLGEEVGGKEGEEEEEQGQEEPTDCQIARLQSSMDSGTVTLAATTASVVVAVR